MSAVGPRTALTERQELVRSYINDRNRMCGAVISCRIIAIVPQTLQVRPFAARIVALMSAKSPTIVECSRNGSSLYEPRRTLTGHRAGVGAKRMKALGLARPEQSLRLYPHHGARGRGGISCDLDRPADRLVPSRPGRGLYRRDNRRPDRPVHLEPACCCTSDLRSQFSTTLGCTTVAIEGVMTVSRREFVLAGVSAADICVQFMSPRP